MITVIAGGLLTPFAVRHSTRWYIKTAWDNTKAQLIGWPLFFAQSSGSVTFFAVDGASHAHSLNESIISLWFEETLTVRAFMCNFTAEASSHRVIVVDFFVPIVIAVSANSVIFRQPTVTQ